MHPSVNVLGVLFLQTHMTSTEMIGINAIMIEASTAPEGPAILWPRNTRKL